METECPPSPPSPSPPSHAKRERVRDARFPNRHTDEKGEGRARGGGGEPKEGFGERFLPSKTGAFMLFIPRHALHRAESTTGPGPGPPTCPFEFGIIWDTFLRRRVPDLHPTPMHNRPPPAPPPPLWRPRRSKKEPGLHRPALLLPNSPDIFAHVDRPMI